MIINAVIRQLPIVGSAVQVFFTVIADDDSLSEATITDIAVMYGNVNVTGTDIFIPYDDFPIALLVTATLDDEEYISILYTKAVNQSSIPDNFARLSQKMPLGIFTDINKNTIIGNDLAARADMANDYYQEYFKVINQVYSSEYSPQLEFEYNGTVGLLSTSAYPNELFQLFSALATVALNVYDLELFLSKYVYYRLGTVSAVYVNDFVTPLGDYWTLDDTELSILDETTILAPEDYNPTIENLQWTIFNASAFTAEFKEELTNLVVRMSRADIGNDVFFSDLEHPSDGAFTLVGFTYKNDPRLIYGRCIEYIGDNQFPLNIVGYISDEV